jgi:soluble lytic murein transglycosylase-like protein
MGLRIAAALIVLTAFAPGVHGYCFQEAGARYGISPLLLKAISDAESNGDIHAVNYNAASGTVDIGHMQINSFWKKHLGAHYETLFEACYCTMVGAWILKQCIDRYGYDWDAVACYHTGRGVADAKSRAKRKHGSAYIRKVKKRLAAAKQP